MGEDKALLPFSTSSTLAQYQYDRLKPYFKNIYISSKNNKFNFLNDNKQLILDENKDIFSPILGLKTIFNRLKNQKIFIIPVDTPFVSVESISKLIENSFDVDICIAQTERVHNLCGVFSSNISLTIDSMLKNDIHKIGYLINNNLNKIIKFPNNEEFMNINNKIEYENSLKYISISNKTNK